MRVGSGPDPKLGLWLAPSRAESRIDEIQRLEVHTQSSENSSWGCYEAYLGLPLPARNDADVFASAATETGPRPSMQRRSEEPLDRPEKICVLLQVRGVLWVLGVLWRFVSPPPKEAKTPPTYFFFCTVLDDMLRTSSE